VPTPGPLDPVTGLVDRHHLYDFTVEAIDRSRPQSNRAVVAFVDIGLLRDVNDSFGADAGDALLRQVAQRLSSIDLPNTRALRYEGAEFALVFEQIEHYDMAEEVARFLIDLLSPEFTLGVEAITINPAVGLALSTDNYNSIDDFIRDAHQALLRAREDGPGAYAVHDESKRGRYETRIDEDRLRTAIDNEEFVLAYQPIVRLDNDQIIGFEALLRWVSPSATRTGVLYPRDFMPLLEKSGLSVRVGEWVVHEACRQAAEWNRRFPDRPALFVTANVGARQMASTAFRDQVVDAVTSSGIQAWQLCLDITEQALRFNRSAAWTALRELKDMGVKLGLDDFGTGVSGFNYLREFTLDLLRVDRTFVEGVVVSDEDKAIIKHIAGLAHDLGLVAIAEGVETDEQAAALRTLGVDLAQGFHFGRPMMAREVADLLDSITADEAGSQWQTADVLDYEPE
jgi:diguanylate cyclase (GGDEF)-like protein